MEKSFHPLKDAPITINGYQLLDALNCIAPMRTTEQMQTKVCIHREPICTIGETTPNMLYCWLSEFPTEGSIQLHQKESKNQAIQQLPQELFNVVSRLIEAARWVCTTPSARKQPDALALAKIILQLTCPIIETHQNALQRSRED